MRIRIRIRIRIRNPGLKGFYYYMPVIKTLIPDWIRIRIGIQPKMLDPDPYQMNTDPVPLVLTIPRMREMLAGSGYPLRRSGAVCQRAV